MTHLRGIALTGVKTASSSREATQLVPHSGQFGDATVKVSCSSTDEIGDVFAGRVAPVAKRQHLADLAETEPDRLR